MLEQIKDFVITKVITAGITWLISLLNPASAFVKACKMIYDVIMFFVERGSQIMDAGQRGPRRRRRHRLRRARRRRPTWSRRRWRKALPVAISFLASLLGLGGIADKIKSVIETIQKPVNRLIDKLIGGVLKLFKKLGGDKLIKAVQKGVTWTKEKIKQGKEWAKAKGTQAKDWAKAKGTQAKAWAKAKASGAKAWAEKKVGSGVLWATEKAKQAKAKGKQAKDWVKKKLGRDDSPEGKQKRLSQGFDAGVAAAVNKHQGKRVGAVFLRPLLAGVRLRYGLSDLRPVARGEYWAVQADIRRMTEKKTETKTGGDDWQQRLKDSVAATKKTVDEIDKELKSMTR